MAGEATLTLSSQVPATVGSNWDINKHAGRATKFYAGTITFAGAYETGGTALTLPGITTIDFVSVAPQDGYVFTYDYTNKKVLAYYCDYDGAADAVMIQLAAAVAITTVTRIFVVGH